MKRIKAILGILSFTFSLFGQTATPSVSKAIGGEFMIENTECLSPEARAVIKTQLDANIARLESQGTFTELRRSPQVVAFDWPLRLKAGETDPAAYGISNYVDQNTAATAVQDYNCGARTYDGHKGIDIFSWPFQWHRMDNNSLEIIAAEAGVIVNKIDGFADRNCACVNYDWNAVYIRHADNSVSWYGHMKKNTQTTKAIGQSVAKGEYLGVVGSSGCSTGPHLHFEVYNSANTLIDPYKGDCNKLNTLTWWANQKPNREPMLNRLQLGLAPAGYGDCATYRDTVNETYSYAYGNKMYVTGFFHDQTLGNVTTYTIYQPNNTVALTWTHTSPNTYNSSWWYWSLTLPSGTPGTWRVTASFFNQTIEKTFTLGPTVAVQQADEINALFYPSTFSETVNLSYKAEEKATVELSDIQGRVVKVYVLEQGQTSHTFSTNGLPNGVYVAKIKSSKQPFIQKIIKN